MNNEDNIFKKYKDAVLEKESANGSRVSIDKDVLWGRITDKLDNHKKKVRFIYLKYGLAASIALILGTGVYFMNNNDIPPVQEATISNANRNNTGSNIPEQYHTDNEAGEKAEDQARNHEAGIITGQKNNTHSGYRRPDPKAIVGNPPVQGQKIILADTVMYDEKLVIKGKVTDQKGNPMVGASIESSDLKWSTFSDADGNFVLEIPDHDSLDIVVSYLNMTTTLSPKEDFSNIVLDQSQVSLESVVVTGYRTNTRERYVGAADHLSSGYIQNMPVSEVARDLEGRTPGIRITGNGDLSDVQIRGLSSLSSTGDPLIVIDGKPYDGTLHHIDPNDISNITILRDASATSLYGSRGTNGVIIIQSKEKARILVDTIYSSQDLLNIDSMLRAQQPLWQEAEQNNESYAQLIEHSFKIPAYEPLSTFSIDVDNASYTNIRRMIEDGDKVPEGAVRIEEMINFFRYDYPEPSGKHPFQLNTEFSTAPWNPDHRLLRIGIQGKNIEKEKLPPSNLVFLIDVSGSMSGEDKLGLVQQSMKLLVEQLREEDRVSIVTYAGNVSLVLAPTSGGEKEKINDAIDRLEAGGSTAGASGIQLAYDQAQKNFFKNGNNRIILATDGDFNVGQSSDEEMEKLIVEKRKGNIFLTCLGYGMGNYKDSKLEILANKGNGNYAYIDDIREAKRVLEKEFGGTMFTLAKDVKIQIEFNPSEVQSYRLIGYENRILQDEDFVNDTIDAGELGVGHQVTALYEIIPVGMESSFIPEVQELKYTSRQKRKKQSEELATIKFRYKNPDGHKSKEMVEEIPNKVIEIDKTSADFKLASSVAWFGLWLRHSRYVPNLQPEDILRWAEITQEQKPDEYTGELVELIREAKEQEL